MRNTVLIILVILTTYNMILGQSAESFYQSGNEMLESGDIHSADSLYQLAIQADPSFAPALLGLGRLYFRLGDMTLSKDNYLMAIDSDPENEDYRKEYEKVNQAKTLMNDGNKSMNSGLFEDAYVTYKSVLDTFPAYCEAAYRCGLTQFKLEKFGIAVDYFNQALSLNPEHKNARAAIDNVVKKRFNECNQTYKLGDLESALDCYKTVIELNSSFYQAYYQIGVINAKMRDYDGAIVDYGKAIEIKPDFYKGWFALGLVKKMNGEIDGAIAAFQRVIEIHPGYVKAYTSISEIYIQQEKYDEAIEELNIAAQVDGSYYKIYSNLGRVYITLEDYENAASNLEMATSLNPKDDKSWYLLAQAYNNLQDCRNAVRAARESTDRKKRFGGAWLELGIGEYCNGKGNKTAALNALEKARGDRTWRKMAEHEIDKIKNPEKYNN